MEEDFRETTKEDFEKFRGAFLRWQDYFDLGRYSVHFYHEELKGENAVLVVKQLEKVACVSLNTQVEKQADLEKLALHEACHLLTSRMHFIGGARWAQAEELDEEDESLAVLLTSRFWDAFDI